MIFLKKILVVPNMNGRPHPSSSGWVHPVLYGKQHTLVVSHLLLTGHFNMYSVNAEDEYLLQISCTNVLHQASFVISWLRSVDGPLFPYAYSTSRLLGAMRRFVVGRTMQTTLPFQSIDDQAS